MPNPRQCAGIRRDGGRCTAVVNGSQEYCYQHDPAYAERRKAAASKAARSKHQDSELTQVKTRLRELAEGVIEGTFNRADASVAGQLYGIFVRACEQARKEREQDDLLARIEQLEQTHSQAGGRWRA
jgi:hypothetical protein